MWLIINDRSMQVITVLLTALVSRFQQNITHPLPKFASNYEQYN